MASAIPTAVTNLLTILRARDGLKSVAVHDGPPTRDTGTRDYICIAHNPDSNTFEFDRQWAGAGVAERQDEAFSIACAIVVWSGSTKMSVRRARAFEILGEVEDALAEHRTLDGAVRIAAVLGEGSLRQLQGPKGAVVDLRFGVGCEARITAALPSP